MTTFKGMTNSNTMFDIGTMMADIRPRPAMTWPLSADAPTAPMVSVASDAAPRMLTTGDIARAMRHLVRGLDHERFWVMALDADMHIIEVREVAVGDRGSVKCSPAAIIRPLIRCNAAYGVMMHNHPSGNALPSEQDVRMTCMVQDIAVSHGVNIIESMVLTDTENSARTGIIGNNYATMEGMALLRFLRG